jgi:predicted RNA-binding Zn-ribbon protein involved in translation (DUF1610 family)
LTGAHPKVEIIGPTIDTSSTSRGVDVMEDGVEYECPDCGSGFTIDFDNCPGCGVELDWGDAEVAIDEDLGGPPPDEESEQPHGEVADEGSLFSRTGEIFASLTVLGFLATVLLIRWDTWVRGTAEDSIGDNQRVLIYLGSLVTMTFALLTIWDIIRGPRPKEVAFYA